MSEKYSEEYLLERLEDVVMLVGKKLGMEDFKHYDIPSRRAYENTFGKMSNAYDRLEVNIDYLEEYKKEPTFEPQSIKEVFGIGVRA